MRMDGLRRLGWACLSAMLSLISRGSAKIAVVALAIAEWTKSGAAMAHFNALPVPRSSAWSDR